jgi:hypothetical protein
VIFSQEERWIKTHDPAGPNVALFHYSSQPLHYTFHYGERNPYRGWYALGIGSVTPAVEMQASWKGLGDQLLVTLIEPRRTLGTGIIQKLTDCSANQQDGIAGFRAETSKGGTVTFLAAPTADRKDNVLEIGACRLNGEALLVFEQPGELTRGLVLGCQELTWMGKKQEVGETDFEFVVTNGTIQVAAPIRYPRAAEITAQPPAGLYADSVNVDLQYTGPVGGELRYTLDGSSPHSGATRYTGCLALTNTTTVKAQAFRRNQAVGNVATIRYQIVTLLPIRIAGKTYAKGLGLHAQADVRYVLQPEYKRFVAVAGVDDSTGYKGNMIFRVLADDKQLAESPVLSGAALRYWHFDCPLPAGARILRLVAVAAPNSGGYNMGDWVNAGFIKNK